MLDRGQEKWDFNHLPPVLIACTIEATCKERKTEKIRGYHSFPSAHAQNGGVALGDVSFSAHLHLGAVVESFCPRGEKPSEN